MFIFSVKTFMVSSDFYRLTYFEEQFDSCPPKRNSPAPVHPARSNPPGAAKAR